MQCMKAGRCYQVTTRLATRGQRVVHNPGETMRNPASPDAFGHAASGSGARPGPDRPHGDRPVARQSFTGSIATGGRSTAFQAFALARVEHATWHVRELRKSLRRNGRLHLGAL